MRLEPARHLEECDCDDCHQYHKDEDLVIENAQTHRCCSNEFHMGVADGRICPIHPNAYAEPGYCEICNPN